MSRKNEDVPQIILDDLEICPDCDGSEYVGGDLCVLCGGVGVVFKFEAEYARAVDCLEVSKFLHSQDQESP